MVLAGVAAGWTGREGGYARGWGVRDGKGNEELIRSDQMVLTKGGADRG